MSDYSKLSEAYNEAEKAILEFETSTGEFPVPALNEMRYAGYHAIKSLLVQRDEDKDEEVGKSVSHCRRAYFDAQSFLLLILIARVKNIREGLGAYLHIFPEMVGDSYGPKKRAVEDAYNFVKDLRERKKEGGTDRWSQRQEWYEECKPHIGACRAYIQMFESIREELCSKVDEAKRKEEQQTRWRWITAILTLVGIFVAILVAILGR